MFKLLCLLQHLWSFKELNKLKHEKRWLKGLVSKEKCCRISIRETNCAIQWIVIYPVDSALTFPTTGTRWLSTYKISGRASTNIRQRWFDSSEESLKALASSFLCNFLPPISQAPPSPFLALNLRPVLSLSASREKIWRLLNNSFRTENLRSHTYTLRLNSSLACSFNYWQSSELDNRISYNVLVS